MVKLKIPDSLFNHVKVWWKDTQAEDILRFKSGMRGPVFGLALLALAAYVLSDSLMEAIHCPD
ncbi:MAG: hypothetical protein QF445_02405, partial [Candidatus Poseidoniaceae archaeon]|nr:hypothetical protein [Candidatus Poseidoniaceae archaeon]